MTGEPTTATTMTPGSTAPQYGAGRLVPRASLVLVLVALPLVLLAKLPLLGWGVAAGLWVAGVALHGWVRSTAARASANAAIGLAAAAMFARMGIAMAVILYVGGSADMDGSTFGLGEPSAAVVALVLYTLVFTLDMGERIGADMSVRRDAAALRQEGSEA